MILGLNNCAPGAPFQLLNSPRGSLTDCPCRGKFVVAEAHPEVRVTTTTTHYPFPNFAPSLSYQHAIPPSSPPLNHTSILRPHTPPSTPSLHAPPFTPPMEKGRWSDEGRAVGWLFDGWVWGRGGHWLVLHVPSHVLVSTATSLEVLTITTQHRTAKRSAA
jgi:hypothetical protein